MVTNLLDNTRLVRELAYYKDEFKLVCDRMTRASTEVTEALADASRARSLTNLLLSTSMIADFGGPETDVNDLLLSKIMECIECDRGMLFRSTRIDASEHFSVIAAIGVPTLNPMGVDLRRVPEFLYTTDTPSQDETAPSSEAIASVRELKAFIGTRHVLWGHDPIGQVALLLGKHQESNLSSAFRREDNELTRVALAVYRDVHHRRDAIFKSRLTPAPDPEPPTDGLGLVGKKASAGIRECDIHDGIRKGGKVIGFLVVDRSTGANFEFVAYVRASWSRHYQVLRRARDHNERVYRDLSLLVHNARFEFGFQSPVVTYAAGMRELQRFEGISQRDKTPLDGGFEDGTTEPSAARSILALPFQTDRPLGAKL